MSSDEYGRSPVDTSVLSGLSTDVNEAWFSARQLAGFCLPGMPSSDAQWRRIAKKGRWPMRTISGKGGAGGVLTIYRPPQVILDLIAARSGVNMQPSTPEQARPDLVAREERAGYVVIRDQDGREVDELVMVPRIDVQVSGGHGATVHSEQIVDSLAFKAAWVRANGLQPSRLALVEAVGESMQPTIQRGDLLLVDLRVNHPAQEGLFVIRRDDTLQVKRLQQLYTGEILVRSDNPAYVAENIPPDRAGELQIIGRVVWTCRRI